MRGSEQEDDLEYPSHAPWDNPWVPADGDSKCELCSRPNVVWWVQSEIWNAVMGSEAGVLCPSCFIIRATAAGFGGRGAWQLYPPPA